MGNEKSALRGLEIEDKAVEVTDYWMHYDASINDSNLQKLSVFISEPSLHFTATFRRPSPLERAAKVNSYLFYINDKEHFYTLNIIKNIIYMYMLLK